GAMNASTSGVAAASLDRAVRDHAARAGGTVAVASCGRTGTRTLTWRELDTESGALAARLVELATRHRPACLVVSLVAGDAAEAVVLVACLRTGTPVLVVNGRQPAPMHQALLDEVRRDGY